MDIDLRSFNPSKNILSNKVILISGASSGIGKEAAITFSDYGACVILTGRKQKDLEEVSSIIQKKNNLRPSFYEIDFESANSKDYCKIYNEIDSNYGKLDGLLNNAGILGEKKLMSQYPYETWKKVMDVNVNSVFRLTQTCLPLLSLAKDASIIFTSSSVGKKGRAFWGAYSVSKFATEAMMEILSDEIENTHNIRVNSINPGPTNTKLRSKAYPAEDPSSISSPGDIMKAYLFLFSSHSININGRSIDAQTT
ncbi:MAG: YciK family oxidoreductase [SAR86 cluster bacterium]|jgi:NAD(P)-dependent dehydrogenase (short-subunit alcohol dehydrogenase family)|nr:YciK family oxidoreductase [SAR86 cluster bacterium]|tara:strand:+ start:8657 stop:9415 length:759 start_codon:yes stop_codon:yes gene_type:complete